LGIFGANYETKYAAELTGLQTTITFMLGEEYSCIAFA